jgi:hypothetical protein
MQENGDGGGRDRKPSCDQDDAAGKAPPSIRKR